MGPVADIRNLTFAELRAEFDSWGEPAYRAKQVFEWIYQKGADSFAAMTDLPKSLRQRLGDKVRLGVLELAEQLRSEDGTEKLLFRPSDGQLTTLDTLVRAVRIMTAPEGMGIAARRMTISTVGIVPAIEKLEGLGLQV